MSEENISEEKSNLDESTVPFFPDHIGLEAKWALGLGIICIIIGIVGIFLPVGLQEPADPMNTPTHVKPEWYFLGMYQILKYVPKNIGAVAPVIGLGLVLIWPFLDRKPDNSRKTTRIRLILSIVFVVIFIALTIWGEVS